MGRAKVTVKENMNRRQRVVLFLVIVALVATWLFPHWIPRYKEEHGPFKPGPADSVVYPPSPSAFYAFLFTESGVSSRIDWARLILTDLIIVAVGASVVYVLRSKT
jgi:hypothetical protein